MTIEDVLRAVSWRFAMRRHQLIGFSREASSSVPRQLAMFFSRRYVEPTPTYQDLGAWFGRDHKTVMYGIEQTGRRLLEDADLVDDAIAVADRIEAQRRVERQLAERSAAA